MNELLNINGVNCYEENGVAYLNLEDVARGLGFTRTANSGNEVVMWSRVEQYLDSFGVHTCAHDDFIPENVFYRLAMKAKNETAEKFQALVADEIIPSIRKHGAYMAPDTIEKALSDPDTIIKLAQTLKEERQKRKELEQEKEANKPKVIFADAVSVSDDTILVGALAKIIKQNGVDIGQNRLFEWLRRNHYLIKYGRDRNMPTQRSLEMKLFKVKERTVQNPDGSVRISRTVLVTGKGQQYFINKFLSDK